MRSQFHRLLKCAINHRDVCRKAKCREAWPPTEDGGGAASAERKADRPVQLEPHRPAEPASAGVQPRPGAKQRAAEGPGCLHCPDRQKGE